MCTSPVIVFVLRRHKAVQTWKEMCGPTYVDEAKKLWPESLRAIYGVPGKEFKNVCHASDTEEKAREEIRFFFPRSKVPNLTKTLIFNISTLPSTIFYIFSDSG